MYEKDGAIRYGRPVQRRSSLHEPEDEIVEEYPPRPTRRLPSLPAKEPVMQPGYVTNPGGKPQRVQVIFVQELIKTALMYALLVVLVICLTVIFQKWWFNNSAGNYTYAAYRRAISATNTPCTLDGSLRGVNNQGVFLLCPETNKPPTPDQTLQWRHYLDWQACYEFGDSVVCAQINK